MTELLNITFKPEKGKPTAYAIQQLLEAVAGTEAKRLVLILKEQPSLRSLNQNRFYQGPFIEAFQQNLLQCGQRVSQANIHAGLRDAHAKNAQIIMLSEGVPFRIPPSTARLKKLEFEQFLEEIRAEYAGRFGWQLPFPNE